MARKRMFDLEVINQDSFFDLPMEAKALYFLLGMEADDEGFVSPKKILRLYGGTEDSLKILAIKEFIIPFKTGVIVITDWKRNNYLDKNRIKETIYQKEKEELQYDEIREKYVLKNECLTNVKPMLNQYSIEENSIEENIIEKKENNKKEKYGNFGRVKLTKNEYQRLIDEFGEDFIKQQINLLDEYVESNNNKNKYSNFNLVIRKSIRDNWFNKKETQSEKINRLIKEAEMEESND